MAKRREHVALQVMLLGRDIGWLLRLGEYDLAEQIAIRDQLAIAEKTAFLDELVRKIQLAFENLSDLEDHWQMLQDNSEHFDMDRHEQEVNLFKGVTFKKLDAYFAELSERLTPAEMTVDARGLQQFLALTFTT